MNKAILAAEYKLALAQKEVDEVIKRVQSECSHDDVVKGEAYLGDYITGFPFAVCKDCGYSEEGWGCGYKKLRGKPMQTIDRGEASKFIKGNMVRQKIEYD